MFVLDLLVGCIVAFIAIVVFCFTTIAVFTWPKYATWALVLIAQSAATTWASRARNSASVPYHALAATFSHGVWFCSNLLLLESVWAKAQDGASIGTYAALGLFYTTFNVIGGVLTHYVSMHYLESGKRRVGANE